MSNTAAAAAPRYFCLRCRWEMPPDLASASPGWAFCSVCGTPLTTEMPESLASALPAPAGAPGSLDYAGFWRRFAGYVLDYALTFVGALILLVLVEVVIRGSGAHLSRSQQLAIAYATLLPINATYHVVFNASGGTLGKRACRLRLVDEDGGRPGWRRSTIRFIISIFSGLVFAWGYWRMVFEPEKQTLHDQAAGTYVVRASSAG